MNNEALKAWLDAMPIDDVRRRNRAPRGQARGSARARAHLRRPPSATRRGRRRREPPRAGVRPKAKTAAVAAAVSAVPIWGGDAELSPRVSEGSAHAPTPRPAHAPAARRVHAPAGTTTGVTRWAPSWRSTASRPSSSMPSWMWLRASLNLTCMRDCPSAVLTSTIRQTAPIEAPSSVACSSSSMSWAARWPIGDWSSAISALARAGGARAARGRRR